MEPAAARALLKRIVADSARGWGTEEEDFSRNAASSSSAAAAAATGGPSSTPVVGKRQPRGDDGASPTEDAPGNLTLAMGGWGNGMATVDITRMG